MESVLVQLFDFEQLSAGQSGWTSLRDVQIELNGYITVELLEVVLR